MLRGLLGDRFSRRTGGWAPLLLAGDEATHPAQRLGQCLRRGGVGAADEALAAVAESGAGDDGDPLLVQQALREFFRREPGGSDRRKGVKGAVRFEAVQADRPETGDDQAA